MHDKIRKITQRNAKKTSNQLVKNGKFYVPPKAENVNFKTLFARLASEGAGRPVDNEGFPDGPWTPETLADAISSIEGNVNGIELRAVQVWFQQNDNGINNDNIRWLARVFGCNDPELTSLWQKQLVASRDRLTAERRAKKKAAVASNKIEPSLRSSNESKTLIPHVDRSAPRAQVDRINHMFTSNNLYLIILVWAGWAILAFSASIIGVGHVTYTIEGGIEKEIGFYNTPTWTVEKVLLIPLYILITSRAVIMWLSYREGLHEQSLVRTWKSWLSDYRFAFYAINAVSIIIVFGMQWYGSYLQPLLDGPSSGVTQNWLRVTTNPEPLAPLWVAIGVSLFLGIYIGTMYWFCFCSLLLLFIASQDFTSESRMINSLSTRPTKTRKNEVAQDLILALYRSAICGILMSMAIKVSIIYLDVDSPTLTKWLFSDFLTGIGYQANSWSWNGARQLATATSGMFMFVITVVAYLGIYRIKFAVEQLEGSPFISHTRLVTAPIFMIVGFHSIGLFTGFSMVFSFAVIIGIWQLLKPSLVFRVYSRNSE